MPEPYVAEAPPPRVRVTDRIDSKLDRIIDLVSGGVHRPDGDGTTGEGSEGPTVTFEADPEGLPTAATVEGEDEDNDPAGNGEGTANTTATPAARAGFRHPSAKRRSFGVEGE